MSSRPEESANVRPRLRPRAAIALALGVALLAPASALGLASVRGSQNGLPDLDARPGAVKPTAAQRQTVRALGAHVTWNRFGTPASLIDYGGYLATGLSGGPVKVARSFVSRYRGLFRLTATGIGNLKLLNDSPLTGSGAHAVMLRQTFGGLPATQDGLITVGVVGGKVAYVSSSAAGDGSDPAPATLSPQDAWAAAASDAGLAQDAGDVVDSTVQQRSGWTRLRVAGIDQLQRVRLTAFPTYTQGVKPAYETLVVDTTGAWPIAYKDFVDARTGAILLRQNAVDSATDACDPNGSACAYSDSLAVSSTVECGPYEGPFTAGADAKSIDVAVTADVPANDIVVELDHPQGTVVAGQDTLTSPEAIHYEPSGGVAPGDYYVRVCPFTHSPADYTAPYTYHGTIAISSAATTSALDQTPKWQAFLANPPLDYSSADTRVLECWVDSLNDLTPDDADCDLAVKNTASRAPWDFDTKANAPTFTTHGNNATTAEAWESPLTPGGVQRPVALDRDYSFPWTNAWHESGCDPASLTPGGNDIDAAVTNLFVGHNRMHDFSYELGFTETNFNAQESNFGNTAPGPFPAGREGDPETGDVQAGAITGGAPTYEGRDNANQITLNDGVPPITNQYLFQPIAGAFYSPCVDGDFDTSVFGHEYTHLISNRMVGGPDAGLTGAQAGAMGESWSDLDALEYEHEYGLVPTGGENPWSVGAYVTGNRYRGIRDYPLDANPLNYSDVGFDVPGPEVHADGEIWNAVNYDIRQALVEKFDDRYPSSDRALQIQCAKGAIPVTQCPGNRRWIQTVYDAWLLMQPGVSMLDARDAYLAADMMRFHGANQNQLWHAFASRGMGIGASSNTTEDDDPTPSFESPNEPNATVTFETTNEAGRHAGARIYVGRYQGRATPIADTIASTPLDDTAKFVPGTYEFVIQGPGYGLKRSVKTFTAGETAQVTFPLQANWASRVKGATATGDGAGLNRLIDDNEGTNWIAADRNPTVAGTAVTVDLAGGAHTVSRARVSAMLGPGQNRFSALRRFRIDACDATAGDDCSSDSGYSPVYTSPPDAFPGSVPRPVAPNLIMRDFRFDPVRATHLRLVVLTNQCTGGPDYQGDQDSDPTNDSDCVSGSSEGQEVSAAEFEAFGG